jgi:hypothetical protein
MVIDATEFNGENENSKEISSNYTSQSSYGLKDDAFRNDLQLWKTDILPVASVPKKISCAHLKIQFERMVTFIYFQIENTEKFIESTYFDKLFCVLNIQDIFNKIQNVFINSHSKSVVEMTREFNRCFDKKLSHQYLLSLLHVFKLHFVSFLSTARDWLNDNDKINQYLESLSPYERIVMEKFFAEGFKAAMGM